ncbi:cellulase family glycosylhydrolase [Actinocrispum sp. NPDC049592]|uniref:cellulase family glycosylhydrolase n=1 Tax=Actinocrispum sp. NPDC049592 TaxID=3154835 RepID=UPI0034464D40
MARSRWPALALAGCTALCGLVLAQPASAAPVRYESEDQLISQGQVDSNHQGYTGTGFVNVDNLVGSYVEYTVNAPTAGTYSLIFRYANGTTANRPMNLTVNGGAPKSVAFPATGEWTNWQNVTTTATLAAGSNKIRTTSTTATGGPNTDSLTVDTAGTDPEPPAGDTPVAINGQLHVCGTKLCNKYDKPVQLRGMSTHGIQWYAQCVKTASLDALANDWKADIFRISMYIQEGGYETNPRKFTDLVHGYIEEATKRGMYALVDWHQLTPGDPNANLARAKTFFTEIAQRHKDKINIIYDIANEPNGVSWPKVKSYAEQMIPVIRAQDPDGVVFVGTHGWSTFGISDGGSETEVFNNPINATNFMYTFHFYAASHKTNYLNALSRIADRVPVFVTEFGTQTSSGDGGNDFTMSQQYIDLMASKKIGWTNWNFSDDNRSGAVFKTGTCSGNTFAGTSVLKPAGVWVRDRTRTPDDFPTG